VPGIQQDRLEFARWLATEQRIGEGTSNGTASAASTD
jgi:hypothetical protein